MEGSVERRLTLGAGRAAHGGVWLAAMLAGLACGAPATADAHSFDSSPAFEFSAGAFGVLEGADDAFRVSAEYRRPPMGSWRLAPGIGASVDGDRSTFIYADLRREFWLESDWVVSLSFGAGRFRTGEVLRLGGDLEFQSAISLARRLRSGLRVGTSVQHLSNGGLYDENPGTEVVALLISMPVGPKPMFRSFQSASVGSDTPSGSGTDGESARVTEPTKDSPDTSGMSATIAAASSSRRISSPASAR